MNRHSKDMVRHMTAYGETLKILLNEKDLTYAMYDDGDPIPNETECEQLINGTASKFLISRYPNLFELCKKATEFKQQIDDFFG